MNAKINMSCFVMEPCNSEYVWKTVTERISGNDREKET